MPVNHSYKINEVIAACKDYIKRTSRRITFEYSLIRGVNDSTKNADELAELIGLKTLSKGVKVQIVDDTIKVDAIILVRYGCNIVNVAREVQNSVTEAVQAITGIDKSEVNVHVSGVAFEK